MTGSTLRRLSALLLLSLAVTALAGAPAGASDESDHRDDAPERTANPDLAGACGLDLILVLDRSQSVGGNAATVQAAANTFLEHLAGTGSVASLVSFGTTATQDAAPTALTSGANLDALEAAVNGLTFDGDTNWEDALAAARDQFPAFPDGKPQLVVLVTDGNPNKWNDGGPHYPYSQTAEDRAVVQANAIKADGVHLFALGVDGQDGLRVESLQAISGSDQYPGTALSQADWTTVDGFGELGSTLAIIATDLCQAPAPPPIPSTGLKLTKNGPAQAHEGDQVSYSFTVQNTGETAVSGLSISDDVLGAIAVDGTLAPGASIEVKKGYPVPLNRIDDVVNTAKVCGSADRSGTPEPVCSGPAVHRLDVLHPAVTIDKTADPSALSGPGQVTYTYVVRNSGDVGLADVKVNDDILGAIGSVGSLGAGRSLTLTKQAAVTAASPTRNVGSVTGTDPLGLTVSASDDAVISVTEVLGEVLELPRTGNDPKGLLLAGLALCFAGLYLVVATGRRTRRA